MVPEAVDTDGRGVVVVVVFLCVDAAPTGVAATTVTKARPNPRMANRGQDTH